MIKVILLLISAVLVGIDQLTKYLAVVHLKDQASFVLWPGVFEFRYCENTGVAFSLLENQRWLFIPMTAIVAVAMIVILFRSPLCRHKLFSFSCALILAGGVGNLIDRIVLSYVVDFLYFSLIDFPIFNFADCCVVIGACLLFVFLLFVYKDKEDTPLRTLLLGIPVKKKETQDGGE